MSERWRPIKVTVIDLESCPESISGAPDYEPLWALIRERGRPRVTRVDDGDGPQRRLHPV